MTIFMRKRSTWASGRGYVPSCSTGFCVANTVKAAGNGRVLPSTVTCRSSIDSRRAAWVLGGARLISSARIRSANTGPGRYTNSRERSSSTLTPTKSVGIRSGVN